MAVPILDESYMRRRAQLRVWQAQSDALRDTWQPDTAKSLREEYALGKITYAEFERRLERVLGCT